MAVLCGFSFRICRALQLYLCPPDFALNGRAADEPPQHATTRTLRRARGCVLPPPWRAAWLRDERRQTTTTDDAPLTSTYPIYLPISRCWTELFISIPAYIHILYRFAFTLFSIVRAQRVVCCAFILCCFVAVRFVAATGFFRARGDAAGISPCLRVAALPLFLYTLTVYTYPARATPPHARRAFACAHLRFGISNGDSDSAHGRVALYCSPYIYPRFTGRIPSRTLNGASALRHPLRNGRHVACCVLCGARQISSPSPSSILSPPSRSYPSPCFPADDDDMPFTACCATREHARTRNAPRVGMLATFLKRQAGRRGSAYSTLRVRRLMPTPTTSLPIPQQLLVSGRHPSVLSTMRLPSCYQFSV